MKTVLLTLICVVLVFAVGCKGISMGMSDESMARVDKLKKDIEYFSREKEMIEEEVKAMRESGEFDPALIFELLAKKDKYIEKVDAARDELLAELQRAKEAGFEWYDYLGFILMNVLTYLGVGRPIRKGFGKYLVNPKES